MMRLLGLLEREVVLSLATRVITFMREGSARASLEMGYRRQDGASERNWEGHRCHAT